jgi:hypothetical protein
MVLIKEFVDIKDMELIVEDGEKLGCHSKKDYYVSGPFMCAEDRNKNGRVYPRSIMEKAVNNYNENFVKTGRAIGELDHPLDQTLNLKNASHKIISLGFRSEDDHKVYGKAKILNENYFPLAKIAKGFLEEGIMLGISSRGVGSLDDKGMVGDDFQIISLDLVANPSGSGCFLEGILENKEYFLDGENQIVERAVNNLKKATDRKYSSTDSKLVLEYFQNFMNDLRGKL